VLPQPQLRSRSVERAVRFDVNEDHAINHNAAGYDGNMYFDFNNVCRKQTIANDGSPSRVGIAPANAYDAVNVYRERAALPRGSGPAGLVGAVGRCYGSCRGDLVEVDGTNIVVDSQPRNSGVPSLGLEGTGDRRGWNGVQGSTHADDTRLHGSTQQSVRSPRQAMKPCKYDGSTPIDTFLIQFATCPDYNQWTAQEKAALYYQEILSEIFLCNPPVNA